MQNKNVQNTAKYVITQDVGFRSTFTMTVYQTDAGGTQSSDTMALDITVCGAETLTDITPGIAFSKLWTVPASNNEIIERDATIKPLFTIDNSGADTHINCVFAVFETFMDSSCSTPVSDPKLT